jgi:hypothetical protein
MNAEIAEKVSSCSICLDNRNANPKEPMELSDIPDLPWETVGTDLFHWNETVTYLSKYFEIAKLEKNQVHMKSISARHEIPKIVRSDCGPQYTSGECRKFSEEWEFAHQKSSPNYQQSNGTIGTDSKRILTKSQKEGKDPYVRILSYRNTPIESIESPAQILMNSRLRSTLPATNKPKCTDMDTTNEIF